MGAPINGEYPQPFGAKKASVFYHAGPASYTQMTAGPVAGGDTCTPEEAGLNRFECVVPVGLSDSGTYRVEGVAPAANPSNNRVAAGTCATWVLRWVVVATGAQAAGALDLSAERVRLFALGRY
jgi:hypothetical protein